ncbi:MAG: hypothetical protein H6R24_565 [Proteobacteria bacterium]|nr:hypothetical protein [Pseudomonadota bacterium]
MTASHPMANHGATSLLQWVWRSYFRTALIPLLVVEVAFIAIYLAANHLATQESPSFLTPTSGTAMPIRPKARITRPATTAAVPCSIAGSYRSGRSSARKPGAPRGWTP